MSNSVNNAVHPDRQARIRGPLKFFSIAATITGIFLLILVARMILQYGVGMEMPSWATLIAQAHGVAYMVYLCLLYTSDAADDSTEV